MLLKRFLLLLRPPLENVALIDGQNLYRSTTSNPTPWKIDIFRFRRYLSEKYHISTVYYFMGHREAKQAKFYRQLSHAGYILVFREHAKNSRSSKKGNVDTDIVFMMMREFCKNRRLGKIYLISGDGDYFRTVVFLIQEGHFGKILLPGHRNASALYQKIDRVYRDYLDNPQVKAKIARNQ